MTRTSAMLVALAALVAACAEPVVPEGSGPDGADEPLGAEAVDPGHDLLVDELGRMAATLTAARDRLAEVADAADAEDARQAARAAVALLVDDELADSDLRGGHDPLLPSQERDRGDPGTGGDLLTTTLAAAREAGELGRRATDVLRDAIAGDLGAWQRDPEGMVALIETTARSEEQLGALEAAVLELPGEVPRALAWALLAAEAADADTAGAYAERGMAHLGLALTALDELDLDGAGVP